jgi:O-succinylbenzoate synthase
VRLSAAHRGGTWTSGVGLVGSRVPDVPLRPLKPVAVDGVELRQVRLPLRAPWVTSHGSMTERAVLVVRVAGADSEGWGECAALETPGYSEEYVEGAAAVLRRFLVPALWGGVPLDAPALGGSLAVVRGHRMAKAALEMAVLDAQLRQAGVPLHVWLGATRRRVPAGVAVGITRPVGALLDSVGRFVAAGYQRVKLKIEPGWDVEPLGAVRDAFGPGLALHADANGAYARLVDPAAALARLDPFELAMIEQPLDDDDLAGHATLAARIATPVCLDESIVSAAAARSALDLGACRVVNLKPGRVGGYLEAVRVHDLCVERGVGLWCGGMLETGLARAANVALAALPGFDLPGDLSGSDRFYEQDLTAPLTVVDGEVEVSDEPGVGPLPRAEALSALTEHTEWLARPT